MATLCNLCGLSCELGPEGSPSHGDHGLIGAEVVGGYESTPGNGHGALDDMDRYRFSLCEFCLDWLFQQFVIPVEVTDPMNDYILKEGETIEEGLERMGGMVAGTTKRPEPPPWRPACERVLADDWRTMKKAFFAELGRRGAARRVRGVRGPRGMNSDRDE